MPRRRCPVVLVAWLLCCVATAPLRAQEPPHDDNLPAASPEALGQLSDDRLRQRIMRASIEPYHGSCACPYQTRPNGHSCRGHIHILKRLPPPLCYPRQVTDDMLADWRRRHLHEVSARH